MDLTRHFFDHLGQQARTGRAVQRASRQSVGAPRCLRLARSALRGAPRASASGPPCSLCARSPAPERRLSARRPSRTRAPARPALRRRFDGSSRASRPRPTPRPTLRPPSARFRDYYNLVRGARLKPALGANLLSSRRTFFSPSRARRALRDARDLGPCARPARPRALPPPRTGTRARARCTGGAVGARGRRRARARRQSTST